MNASKGIIHPSIFTIDYNNAKYNVPWNINERSGRRG